jgi:hypothetical protein
LHLLVFCITIIIVKPVIYYARTIIISYIDRYVPQ